MHVGDAVKGSGWLKVVNCQLLLEMEVGFQVGVVEVSDPEIIFSVLEEILPLGGGNSFICHKAKVEGVLLAVAPPKIKLDWLSVEERGEGFIAIDVSPLAIERHRGRYERFCKEVGRSATGDWLDFL